MSTQDTSQGFVCVSPWASVEKSVVLDLNVLLAGKRTTRNILSSRNSVKSESNIHQEGATILAKAGSNQAPLEFKFDCPSGNRSTVITSNRPVRFIIKTTNGELDMGESTLFVFTGSLVSFKVINSLNEGNAEINWVVA